MRRLLTIWLLASSATLVVACGQGGLFSEGALKDRGREGAGSASSAGGDLAEGTDPSTAGLGGALGRAGGQPAAGGRGAGGFGAGGRGQGAATGGPCAGLENEAACLNCMAGEMPAAAKSYRKVVFKNCVCGFECRFACDHDCARPNKPITKGCRSCLEALGPDSECQQDLAIDCAERPKCRAFQEAAASCDGTG